MSFIKTKTLGDMLGQEATLIRDCSAMKGTIPKGSVVIITGVSNRGFDIKDKESGEELIECGFDCIEY